MEKVPSFSAQVYVGRKNMETGETCPFRVIEKVVQKFVNQGACVSVTKTTFFYKHGSEEGVVVGFINYPRFPKTPLQIKEAALRLGELLRCACNQKRVSIVFPTETIMLSDKGAD